MKAWKLKKGDTVEGWTVTRVQAADERDYGGTWEHKWTLLNLERSNRRSRHEWYADTIEGGSVCRHCGLILGQANRSCEWIAETRQQWFESDEEVYP